MSSVPAIDCEEAIQHLYDLLDRELTADLEGQVREHFRMCARCYPLLQFEQAFARFLQARTRTRGAPEGLRRRIFEQIMLDDNPTS